jgi:uncharacterized membrane protein YdbT with pleckstrin-like domain
MSPTEGTLRRRFPLMRAKIVKRSLSSCLPITVLGLVGAGILAFASPALAALAVLAVILADAAVGYYNVLYFDKYFYDLAAEGLVIGKGVIGSWRITVPAHKIQDVYLDQDLLDRLFGLYDLHMSTPSDASEREAHIDGLGKADAEALRTFLIAWLTGQGGTAADASSGESVLLKPSRAGLVEALASAALATGFLLLWVAGAWGLIGFPFIFAFTAAIAYLDYTAISYRLRGDGVLVRTGYFIPKESIFLYRNIQDVEDQQTLMDRLFGTHTLLIKTMTSSSAIAARLKYISPEDAENSRRRILENCKGSAKEAAEASPSHDPSHSRTRPAEPPMMDALRSPYGNMFYKRAHYYVAFVSAAWLALAAASAIVLLLLPAAYWGMGFAALAAGTGLVALLAAATYAGAAISSMSFTYALEREFAQIQIRFVSTTKRQILYRKIQDIERNVSLTDSFAGLADVALETGAKEVLQDRNRGEYASSSTVANEVVPALSYADAEKVRDVVARQMEVSLAGLEDDPLFKAAPLSAWKPLKKTLSWAVYSAVLIGALGLAAFAYGYYSAGGSLALGLWYALYAKAAASAASFAACGLKYLYELEYLKRYRYDANADVLVIRKGVFGWRELTIPFSKIQDVYVDRDLLDIAFGLWDVHVSTATGRSLLNAHMDGLDAASAEAVATHIVERIAQVK